MRNPVLILAFLLWTPALEAVEVPADFIEVEIDETTPRPRAKSRRKASRKAARKSKWVRDRGIIAGFVRAVEDHVTRKEDDKGAFELRDEELGKTWRLRMIRVHSKRIARRGKAGFTACADFYAVRGKGKLDLDFFATRLGAERWRIDEILIHSVDGKRRSLRRKDAPKKKVKKRKRGKHGRK